MRHIVINNPVFTSRLSTPQSTPQVSQGYIYYSDGYRVFVRIYACFGTGAYRVKVKLPKHKALNIRHYEIPYHWWVSGQLVFDMEMCAWDTFNVKLRHVFDHIWFTD